MTFLELCDPAPVLIVLSNDYNDGGLGDDDDVDGEDSHSGLRRMAALLL